MWVRVFTLMPPSLFRMAAMTLTSFTCIDEGSSVEIIPLANRSSTT